jgi:nucleotide-binding universal stress UspA family protein
VSTIVIGVDASERSEDAIAFGGCIAEATKAETIVTIAYPYATTPARASNATYRDSLREDAFITARHMRSKLDPDQRERARVRVVADVSAARALQRVAHDASAALLIVGSSHTGRIGRVFPGSTGERLLHHAPCPVAVVPKDYRRYPDDTIRRIGVAYDGSDEAAAAAAAAAALARALEAELELIGIVTPEYAISPEAVDGKGLAFARREAQARVQERLDAAVAALPAQVPAHTRQLTGDPIDLLARCSLELDLLVIGSRGHGPLHSVLVGGVSGRVLRSAHCPVIAVGHGVEQPLDTLLDHSTTAAA